VNFHSNINVALTFFSFWNIVLEPNQALFDPIYNSWFVRRWPVGLCDLWLHTLLFASWPTFIGSCKTPQGSYFILKFLPMASLCTLTHLSVVPQKYHLNHHFRIQNKGFGITSTSWDHVFGTLPSTKTIGKTTWVSAALSVLVIPNIKVRLVALPPLPWAKVTSYGCHWSRMHGLINPLFADCSGSKEDFSWITPVSDSSVQI
jgi:hypothetical protein